MFKLLIITVIVLYCLKFFWRLMYPRIPKVPTIELKACEYCGTLVVSNQGKQQRGHFFCDADHAARYFA